MASPDIRQPLPPKAMYKSTSGETRTSEYTPVTQNTDAEQSQPSNWRPWTLRTPFLALFTVLSIILSVGIELVARACSLDGCRVFGTPSETKLSTQTYFVYNLLPTMVTLVLSLIWAVPHHDIMRLEPYFQMSTAKGATAANSLFLDYPYALVMFVPFRAAWRRHYAVFLSSLILMLMGFLIVPLISAVFVDQVLIKDMSGDARRATSYAADVANSMMTMGFSYTAYYYTWMGGSLPTFTTPRYAVLPVMNTTTMENGDETWTVDTTMFEADLTCESAADIQFSPRVEQAEGLEEWEWRSADLTVTSKTGGYSVKICDILRHIADSAVGEGKHPREGCDEYTTFTTPWTSIMNRVWTRPDSGSPADGSATYLYVWASGIEDYDPNSPSFPSKITASFCTTHYYSQPVKATIEMPSSQVISVDPTGSRTPISAPDAFEGVIFGVPDKEILYKLIPDQYFDNEDDLMGLGYLPAEPPDVEAQLRRRLGVRPEGVPDYVTTNFNSGSNSRVYMNFPFGLHAYALANRTTDTLHELLDPQILESEYRSTLQMFFALAVTEGIVDRDTVEPLEVLRGVKVRGFAANSRWASGAQGGLAAVTLMAAILLVWIPWRRSELDGEPNSLAAAMRLLSASPELVRDMDKEEFQWPDEKKIGVADKEKRYKLELAADGPRVVVATDGLAGLNGDSGSAAQSNNHPQDAGQKLATLPWSLWVLMAWGFVLGLVVVAGLLIAGLLYGRRENGIPTPAKASPDELAYKVPFSFIPPAVGSAIEVILVAFGTSHYLLAAYNTLKRGQAPSHTSLTVDFDKSPPHFQLLRSLRTGNIAMAVLTLSILLANVLTIALAGMFAPRLAQFQFTAEVNRPSSVDITDQFTDPTQEMYYVLTRHLSGRVAAPNWTTPEYYILPFSPVEGRGVQEFVGPTLGVGLDIKCSLVPVDNLEVECGASECPIPGARPGAGVNITMDDPCWRHIRWSIDEPTDTYLWQEFGWDDYLRSTCRERFFAVWLDRPADPSPGSRSFMYQDRYEMVVLSCTAVEKVVTLTAAVRDTNQVLNVSQVQILTGRTPSQLVPSFLDNVLKGITAESQNLDPQRMRWIDNLLVTVQPSTAQNLTNATIIPTTEFLPGTFEGVFRHLFAINVQLYADETLSTDTGQGLAPAQVVAEMYRVDISPVMFAIAIAILVIMIGAVGAVFWRADRKFQGPLPTSLAGMYTHVYASNDAMGDCRGVSGGSPTERARELDQLSSANGRTYKYGDFVGPDGRTHHGVFSDGGRPLFQGGAGTRKDHE